MNISTNSSKYGSLVVNLYLVIFLMVSICIAGSVFAAVNLDDSSWIKSDSITKQVAVGNDRNGSLVLFSIGLADNTAYYKQQLPNGSWSTKWVPLGGESKQIAVGNDRNGSLIVLSVGVDNLLYIKSLDNSKIPKSDWLSLFMSTNHISIKSQADEGSIIFSIGLADNTPYYKQQLPNGKWSTDWVSLGGESKQTAVGQDKNGTFVLFSLGLADNTPYYKYQLTPNGRWSTEWIPLSGESKQIVAGNDKNGNLIVFSVAVDNTLYHFISE